jgi:hypothetical protein
VQVFCIREAATLNLQKLASEFGPDWARDNLVPQVMLCLDCLEGVMLGKVSKPGEQPRYLESMHCCHAPDAGGWRPLYWRRSPAAGLSCTDISACCLQVLAMITKAHYLHRMTVLGALAALAPAVGHDTLCNTMLPVVLACAKDKVQRI